MPLYENVKLEFIQKDILLFEISYISVCSKTILRLFIKTMSAAVLKSTYA